MGVVAAVSNNSTVFTVHILHTTMASPAADIGEDINSPTDSVIGRDFQELSAEEQERQREEWKAELKKTEEEILTLKQVLTAKEIAKEKTSGMVAGITASGYFQSVSSAFGAAKTKISSSMSQQSFNDTLKEHNGAPAAAEEAVKSPQ